MKTLVLAFVIITALASTWPIGIDGHIRFETSDFIKKSANRNSKSAASDIDLDGAYGANRGADLTKRDSWFIENQKFGSDAIISGVVSDDVEAIARGLKIYEWGFARQQKDGSFDHRDNFHSAAFFVEAVARSILYLEASKYKKKFQVQIDSIKPKLLLAANWMLSPATEKAGISKDSQYTHRYYLNACAFSLTGQLFSNTAMIAKAREYVEKALSLQDKTGFNPEKGGFDSGYHSVGLYYAAIYYTFEKDPKTRANLEAMAKKGITWVSSKIKKDGSIDSTGNTRTGDAGENDREGKRKDIPYFTVYKALAYWGLILNDESYMKLAGQIFSYQKSLKKG